jgi:hypothetical protein
MPTVQFGSGGLPTDASVKALAAAVAQDEGVDPSTVRINYFQTGSTGTAVLNEWVQLQQEHSQNGQGTYGHYCVVSNNCATFTATGHYRLDLRSWNSKRDGQHSERELGRFGLYELWDQQSPRLDYYLAGKAPPNLHGLLEDRSGPLVDDNRRTFHQLRIGPVPVNECYCDISPLDWGYGMMPCVMGYLPGLSMLKFCSLCERARFECKLVTAQTNQFVDLVT